MKSLVAAAGTGGHINPAIAIANKIKKENKDAGIRDGLFFQFVEFWTGFFSNLKI